MRKILFLCILFLLSSCTSVKDWKTEFNREILRFQEEKNTKNPNVNNHYFSYYLPSDMQKEKSVEMSVILRYEGVSLLMNANIGNIIQTSTGDKEISLEEDFYRSGERLYHREGEFLSSKNEKEKYLCEVYRYGEEYLLNFSTENFRYYTYSGVEKITELLRHILMIAKSVEVSEEEVISAFSNTVVIDYRKKQVDLFKTIIPRNGQLIDIVLDGQKTKEEGKTNK